MLSAAVVHAADSGSAGCAAAVDHAGDAVVFALTRYHGGDVLPADGYEPTEGREVTIDRDGFFSYTLPYGCYRVDPRLDEEVFINEQAYVLLFDNDDYYYFTSWAVYDEPDCFPSLAEYLVLDGDITAKVWYTYTGIGDVAVGQRAVSDDTGQPLYMTMFMWGLDDDKMLCVEVTSTVRDHAAMDAFILDSITGSVQAKALEWNTDPVWTGEPTQEEIEQAMHDLYSSEPDMDDVWDQYMLDQMEHEWKQTNEDPYSSGNLGPVLP